jgi:hypothetical protein
MMIAVSDCYDAPKVGLATPIRKLEKSKGSAALSGG